MKRISIDNVQTLLSVIGEEDTCLGFEDHKMVQAALAYIDQEIQKKIDAGDVSVSDTILEFI